MRKALESEKQEYEKQSEWRTNAHLECIVRPTSGQPSPFELAMKLPRCQVIFAGITA